MSRTNIAGFFSPFNAIVLLLFLVLSFFGMLNHEIWLDEAHHFLLARDSGSFSELLNNCSREGHPLVWNILLYIITRLSIDIQYMQWLHLVISTAAVIFLLRTDIRKFEKILVIFSYYVFFEYNLISRNYALMVMFLFMLIFLYRQPTIRLLPISICLFLLANTHLFAIPFVFAFLFMFYTGQRNKTLSFSKGQLAGFGLIVLAGIGVSFYQVIPPENYGITFINYDQSGLFSAKRLLKTFQPALNGLFFLPEISFGSTTDPDQNIYNQLPETPVLILSLIAVFIPVLVFNRNKPALRFYLFFCLFMLPLYFILPLKVGNRYFGTFYLVFVLAFCMSKERLTKMASAFCVMIFLLHSFYGIVFFVLDVRHSYSELKNVSEFIRVRREPNEPVFIYNRAHRPVLSAYMREKFFGVETGKLESFVFWQENLAEGILKQKVDSIVGKNNSLMIVSLNIPQNLFDPSKCEKLAEFNKAMLRHENVNVFRYKK